MKLRTRRGFTLVEVLISVVILGTVVMAIASALAKFMHVVATSDRDAAAIELAEDRVEQIQMDPNYNGMDTLYVATESSFPSLPGFTRATILTRVGGVGQPNDYKKIMVTVNGPGLLQPVKRSFTIAAP
jgi:prepilin-type N-terminal cleavage/methylation domain-containing protein